MRRAYKPQIDHNSEFELDLAPLLAVMVKLVPVLLLSSAFVQMNMIETELPQVVQEALKEQNKDEKNKPAITLNVLNNLNIEIWVQTSGKTDHFTISSSGSSLNTEALHQKLIEVKKQYPEVFKVDLKPEQNVPYNMIVKVMDEARKSRDPQVRFPVFDKIKNQMVETEYMFPEIIFINTTEG